MTRTSSHAQMEAVKAQWDVDHEEVEHILAAMEKACSVKPQRPREARPPRRIDDVSQFGEPDIAGGCLGTKKSGERCGKPISKNSTTGKYCSHHLVREMPKCAATDCESFSVKKYGRFCKLHGNSVEAPPSVHEYTDSQLQEEDEEENDSEDVLELPIEEDEEDNKLLEESHALLEEAVQTNARDLERLAASDEFISSMFDS
jgi:hypothetical protein